MPRTLSSPTPFPSPRPPLPAWEPAVQQLRQLCPEQLDTLVGAWLSSLGLTGIRRCSARPGVTTYQAFLGPRPLSAPLHIRIHQRKNGLQVHHVEAFYGSLVRRGIPLGILATSGPISRDALLIAGSLRSPRVRLLAAERWAAELAAHRAGIRRRSLWHWIVELRSALYRRPGSPPRGEGDR